MLFIREFPLGFISVSWYAGLITAGRADAAAGAVKPSSVAATGRVARSSLTGSYRTTIQTSELGSSRAAISGPSDTNPVTLNSRRISSLSIEDKGSTIPLSTMVSARIINQGFQNNSARSAKGKGVAISPPSATPAMCAPNIPSQGVKLSMTVPSTSVILLTTFKLSATNGGNDLVFLLQAEEVLEAMLDLNLVLISVN